MEFPELTIFYVSSDGTEWAAFLEEKLREVDIISQAKDLDSNSGNEDSNNIVLATPSMLEIHTTEQLKPMNPNTSLMVLLGVDENDLKVALLKLQYKNIFDWKFFTAKQTSDSVNALIECIKSLLHKARLSSAMPEYDRLPPPRASMPELRHSDSRHILSTPELQTAVLDRDEVVDVYILSTRKGSEELQISFHGKEYQHNVQAEYIDKTIYRLKIPENFDLDTEHRFDAVDGDTFYDSGVIPQMFCMENIECSSETDIRSNIIQTIFGTKDDPVSLLCKLFGLSESNNFDEDLLDDHLSVICQKLISEKSSDFERSLLADTGSEMWPTLLHFAAEHDLRLLAAELLRLPCSIDACFIMNINKETPQIIAFRNGFTEFTRLIKSFIKVSKVLGKQVTNKDSGVFDESKLETIQEHHNPISKFPSSDSHDTSTDKAKISRGGSSFLDKWIEKMKRGKTKKATLSVSEDVLRANAKEGTKDKATKHLKHSKSLTLTHSKNF